VPRLRAWVALIVLLARHAASSVQPDPSIGDGRDIRPYVKVKTLRGGQEAAPEEVWAVAQAAGLAGFIASAVDIEAAGSLVPRQVDIERQRARLRAESGMSDASEPLSPAARDDGRQSERATSSGEVPESAAFSRSSPSILHASVSREAAASPPPPRTWIGKCAVIDGVAWKQQLPHKQMRATIRDPAILLVDDEIGQDAQRRLVLADDALERAAPAAYEREIVQRLLQLQPDVIMCSGPISAQAMELLISCGVTVVPNVSSKNLCRASRMTNALILPSADYASKVRKSYALGRCKSFRMVQLSLLPRRSAKGNRGAARGKTNDSRSGAASSAGNRSTNGADAIPFVARGFEATGGLQAAERELRQRAKAARKTLLVLEGCDVSRGMTIVLRGGPGVLKTAKAVLQWATLVAYQLRLSNATLLDAGLAPGSMWARAVLQECAIGNVDVNVPLGLHEGIPRANSNP